MIYCWSMIKGEIAYAMSCSATDIEIAFAEQMTEYDYEHFKDTIVFIE